MANELPISLRSSDPAELRKLIEQAKKAITAAGHKKDCRFQGCTCGEVETFKIESSEFWRLVHKLESK